MTGLMIFVALCCVVCARVLYGRRVSRIPIVFLSCMATSAISGAIYCIAYEVVSGRMPNSRLSLPSWTIHMATFGITYGLIPGVVVSCLVCLMWDIQQAKGGKSP